MSKLAIRITAVAAWLSLALGIFCAVKVGKPGLKMGFVNSQRLIEGFKPAYEVEKQLRKEEEDFKSNLKLLEDSLKVYLDSMSAKYNRVGPAEKKSMQDYLSARNQEINNASRGHIRRMEQMRAEKMQSVFQMINAYTREFGDKNGYSIIFGTVQGGNILYGEGTAADITQKMLDGLNERYK